MKFVTLALYGAAVAEGGALRGDAVQDDPNPAPFYHLVSATENLCYETTYTDAAYQKEGFVIGACDPSFNTVVSKDDILICDGHSDENVKYCPGHTRTIEVLKLGKTLDDDDQAPPPHRVTYHLEAKLESVCFETDYIDAHYKSEGFLAGHCDQSYNEVINKTHEVICNGHSEENIKYCPQERITIEVLKLGKRTNGTDTDPRPPPHGPFYHLETKLDEACYETKYIDDHYKSEGFRVGACDSSFNKVVNKTEEVICNGHSEENIKYCPGETIRIEVLKLGKQTEEAEVDAPPPHRVAYHLEAKLESVCFETDYIDAHYKTEGFLAGHCDSSYNDLINKTHEVICNGHSEENIKYCPGDTITIEVLKFGKK